MAGSLLAAPAAGKKAPAGKSAYDIGFQTFEPTLGTSANGDIYFSTTPTSGVAVGWSASIAKSIDKGRSWKDVGPRLVGDSTNPPETNDPYIYVDPGTSRVFTLHMAPILTCSVMSFSDDGGASWTANPRGCSPTVVWDHQTMVAAKPRGTQTIGYPNILHQCVNAVYAAMCARSLDGGLTWGPSVPVYPNPDPANLCGAQHGHLAAGPDGKVYLPTSLCGQKPVIYISEDDGLTWRESVIADVDVPFIDPTVSVDSKGNLYAAYVDEFGWLNYSVSKNDGEKWSKPVRIAKGWTANMPVLVAGDPGKVAIAYPGTDDLISGYKTKGYTNDVSADFSDVAWGANFTVSHNALDAKPKFKTIVSTGSDPIGRGRMCSNGTRCAYLVDFIEAVIGPDGRPYAAFADGCVGACSKSAKGEQVGGTANGLLTTLQDGPPLCSKVCWRYDGAPKSSIDLTEALGFARSPAQRSSSLEHASVSDEERALIRRATKNRLQAVFGN
jgi:hypothetical protein